jgi:UDP-N-acetylglucosamine--N-acetylmuramyl-(pentapeptide) pyrophosphoryl-undecaprenol N-acetylglucosamine transferase
MGAMSVATNGRTPRRWAIAGGGTGGHVTPALALAERIVARGDEVVLLGSTGGLETRLVPQSGFELVTLPAAQVMGRGVFARLAALFAIARGALAARGLLRRRRIEIVVSVGGYASVPAALAAVWLRIPLALVEPNAEPGRANRLCARLAQRLFVQFERAAERLAKPGDARVQRAGIPLRSELVRAFESAAPRRAPKPPLRLLVFGGSQGARQLNEAMMALAPRLDREHFQVVHQSGEADRDRVAAAYADAGVAAEVIAFAPDMPRRYGEADLALSRAGALTVAELAMAGLPALLVPYPFAADDHQTANARALAEAGAAVVLPSRPLEPDDVARELFRLLEAPESLRAMGEAAGKLARPDAAERVVETCAALLYRGDR